MIQFNLLPDVKLDYIRTKYKKRVVMGVSLITSGVFLAIFIILFINVRVVQKNHMNNLNKDIKTYTNKLQSYKDLDKVLTIQNQLTTLPTLHDNKVISSRLYEYLAQITPAQASISDVTLDLEAKTMKLRGNTDGLTTVNKFVDTIKFTTYKKEDSESSDTKAFSQVVLQSFTIGNPGEANSSSYEINFSYDPVIFANNKKSGDGSNNQVQLIVPKIISTRSETEKPRSLFIPDVQEQGAGQ